jgi:beta-1,4-mannosyl-glycoprotein beta-1,4-N-acetylglucosaminyltransferase
MFSDMDEIPSKHVVSSLREEELPAGLQLQQHYYHFNTPVVEPAGQACKYNGVLTYRHKQFKNLHLEKARIINCNRVDFSNIKWEEVGGTEKLKGVLRTIKNAGWSFTHLNAIDEIIVKLKSSSHIEYAHLAEDVTRLKNRLENLVNIYDETIKLKQVKLDNTYPDYLRENQEEFKKFIYKKQQLI